MASILGLLVLPVLLQHSIFVFFFYYFWSRVGSGMGYGVVGWLALGVQTRGSAIFWDMGAEDTVDSAVSCVQKGC
jgi:hypothetical protein